MTGKRNTTQRGYGAVHQQRRKHWAKQVATGAINCARCGQPITPGTPWDLGHTDDRQAWTGPEHTTCNRSAGGTNGANKTNNKHSTIIREW